MSEKTSETIVTTEQIDAAVAKAKARTAAKAAKAGTAPEASTDEQKTEEKKAGKPKKTEAEKEAAKAALTAERAAKKVERDAARAAKKAEKLASRKPAHMSKVEKAASKLPELGETANLLFGDATSNLSQAQLAALALHIQHFNRVKATERALTAKVVAGQKVTIVGGDPRFIGKTGEVTKAQRIRCLVDIGASKPVYLFTSDVVPAEAEGEKTGTEG